MTEANVGPPQPKKHTPSKGIYQKYKTENTNMEPLQANSLEKQIRHILP
jgi:hypothetical protein